MFFNARAHLPAVIDWPKVMLHSVFFSRGSLLQIPFWSLDFLTSVSELNFLLLHPSDADGPWVINYVASQVWIIRGLKRKGKKGFHFLRSVRRLWPKSPPEQCFFLLVVTAEVVPLVPDSFLCLLIVQRVGAPLFLGSTGVSSPFEFVWLFLTCFVCKVHLPKCISSNGTLGQITDCYWSQFSVKYHHWDHGVEVAFVFWGFYLGHPMARGQGHAFLQSLLTTNSSETCKWFSRWICLCYCSCLWRGQLLANRCISYLASTVARMLFL